MASRSDHHGLPHQEKYCDHCDNWPWRSHQLWWSALKDCHETEQQKKQHSTHCGPAAVWWCNHDHHSYSPHPSGGQRHLRQDYSSALNTVIPANWQGSFSPSCVTGDQTLTGWSQSVPVGSHTWSTGIKFMSRIFFHFFDNIVSGAIFPIL